jgi:hypothetical protein
LIHEEYVGVKCRTNRGWASSHLCTTGALWVERLSQMTCTASPGSTAWSIWSRKSRKSAAVCWAGSLLMILPFAMFRAANRSVVPWRS